MKIFNFIHASALLIASCGFALAQDPGPPVDPASLAALQAAITRLNNEVDGLKKLNTDLTTRVAALELEAAPIGTIAAFAGNVQSIPPNWRLCNGDPITRGNDTEALYQAIHHSWGGNDSTILLPDLRGRFLRGVDQGQHRDPDTGQRSAIGPGGNTLDAVGSLQPDQVGEHKHHVTDPGHTHQLNWSQGPPMPGTSVYERTNHDVPQSADATPQTKSARINIDFVDANTTSSGERPAENRPANVAVYWIIRVK
jgi:microcystin-dependent protein